MATPAPCPPPRPPRSLPSPGINGFRYQERYGVIVLCRDADHQERLYTRLKQRGHRVKVVTV